MTKIFKEGNFTVMPNFVLYSDRLSFKAKGLYAYIQGKPEGWDFSSDRIAKETTDGRRAVQSGLKELQEEGLLTRKKYNNKETGQWERQYILRCTTPECCFASTDNASTDNASTENRPINKKRNTNKEKEIKNNIYMSNFEEFRKEYSYKKGKKNAEKSYLTVMRYCKDPEQTHKEIMEGVKKYKKYIKTSKQFQAHASTWLNQQRREDEYDMKDFITPQKKTFGYTTPTSIGESLGIVKQQNNHVDKIDRDSFI